MQTPSQANRHHWDADAANYHSSHPEYLESFYWCPEMLHEEQTHLLGDVSSDSILEIGCGSAPCTQWLQERAAFATGFDISRGMLQRAQPGQPLVQADALTLPYADDSFDKSFSAFGALPFIGDIDDALAEISRVTKPGGTFVFSTTHPMRWVFPDDPNDLQAEISYFEEGYAEFTEDGEMTYVEFHRSISEWIQALQVRGNFLIQNCLEPEWPEDLNVTWGQWSPKRGRLFPGTIIFCCLNVK